MADQIITCGRCEHGFDAMHPQCWISARDANAGQLCPTCAMRVFKASEAWCVWNDCQGVWDETVQPRRAAAEVFLTTTHKDIGGRVVPVLVIPEHEDDVALRHWRETENFARNAA